MVQLNSFDNKRFSGWRRGWGFGKSARDYLNDPAIVKAGRSSPVQDRFYASSAFHKKLWEVGPRIGLGHGDRPDYAKLSPTGQYFTSPVSYDPIISSSKKDIIYKSLLLKSRFPTAEQRVSSEQGPGPAKYDTRNQSGVSEPQITMKGRYLDTRLFKQAQFQPGPDAYDTRSKPGETLRMIRLTGKDKNRNFILKTPGPGQYNIDVGGLSRYHLIPKGWKPPNFSHIVAIVPRKTT